MRESVGFGSCVAHKEFGNTLWHSQINCARTVSKLTEVREQFGNRSRNDRTNFAAFARHARNILQTDGICLGFHKDFANITHVMTMLCAYIFDDQSQANHGLGCGKRFQKISNFFEIPGELKSTPVSIIATFLNHLAYLANFWSLKCECSFSTFATFANRLCAPWKHALTSLLPAIQTVNSTQFDRQWMVMKEWSDSSVVWSKQMGRGTTATWF